MPEPDPHLVVLVSVMNRSAQGDRFSITIWTGGAVVTGMAIASGEYWSLMADIVGSPPGGGGSEGLNEVYSTYADREISSALDPEPEEDEPDAAHLHLRDAQIVVNGEAVGPPMLWRGRLASIDAWTFSALKSWDDQGMHPA
jgi:hypothetical protein